jgi:hypothetical protein
MEQAVRPIVSAAAINRSTRFMPLNPPPIPDRLFGQGYYSYFVTQQQFKPGGYFQSLPWGHSQSVDAIIRNL